MRTTTILPKPNQDGSMSVEKAIASRRSRRDFLPRGLSLEHISQLAWAAQGQVAGSRFRTAPSAGATYPLELYLVTGEGLFRYVPENHSFEQVFDQDLRGSLSSASLGQSFIKVAAMTVVFATEFSRTTDRYGERGIRYVHIEAGHAAQNLHLQAESLGLGSVAVGAFDDAAVSKVLSLPDQLEPLYMVTVGHCRH